MATRADDRVKRIYSSIGPGGHARRACRAETFLLLRNENAHELRPAPTTRVCPPH